MERAIRNYMNHALLEEYNRLVYAAGRKFSVGQDLVTVNHCSIISEQNNRRYGQVSGLQTNPALMDNLHFPSVQARNKVEAH